MAEKINIEELVEKMPPTDKEIEAAQKSAQQPEQQEKPKPKQPEASKFTGPDPAVAEAICEKILSGGQQSILELINLIKDPASPDYKNYKAEYLTHILAVYTGRTGKEKQRKLLANIMAELLNDGKTSKYVKKFLALQLQRIGDKEVVPALSRLLLDEELCEAGAFAMLSIKEGVVEHFRRALPLAKGKCRLVVLHGLAALGDAQSLEAFHKAVNDPDENIRLTAVWGIAKVGDPSSIKIILKAADVQPIYERAKATSAAIQYAELLNAKGKKADAAKVFRYLRDTRTDPKEKYIRDLAEKWLTSFVM